MPIARPVLLAALVAPLVAAAPVHAGEQCMNVSVDFTPTDSLQIVAWVETAAGEYQATVYMTAKTGVYGLGNRPGRFDFNSGPYPNPALGIDDMWPYGRRITTFPVWAHRHGKTFEAVIFQDEAEDNLSHSFSDSSAEHLPYCRPMSADGNGQCWSSADKMMWDTGTCATQVFTDKGKLSPTLTSLYPPRADLMRDPSIDSPSVDLYAEKNPFDGVSRATPQGGMPTEIRWPVPKDLPAGDYVMWIETSKEFDFNATYNATSYPPPVVSYAACGKPYRGQPSIVYKVPFTISETATEASTAEYVGYGDPDGDDGTIRPPDATITTDTPGSGALRFQLVSDGDMYRVRVKATPELDFADPDMPTGLAVADVTSAKATLEFVEPGDDGTTGRVASYEIRIRANSELTEANFADSMQVVANVMPAGPGNVATVELTGLLPETEYWVGIRAYDDCFNESPLAITKLTTAERVVGEVDACFVATAAYGSLMANDVELLRRTRDLMLRRTVLGELFVTSYYTFGPPVAGVIGESDLLRASARSVLAPIIAWVRALVP